MSCKPTYKGVRYNSIEEIKRVIRQELAQAKELANVIKEKDFSTEEEIYEARPDLKLLMNSITDSNGNFNLDKLINVINSSDLGRNGKLFKILSNILKKSNSNLEIEFVNDVNDTSYLGRYFRRLKRIHLNKTTILNALLKNENLDPLNYITSILNHEILHHLIPDVIYNDDETIDDILKGEIRHKFNSKEEEDFVRNIKALYDYVKKNSVGTNFYGLKDLSEFISEALTDIDFQEYLAKIQYKTTKKSAWKSFIKLLNDLINYYTGLNISNTTLEAAVAEISNYLNNVYVNKSTENINNSIEPVVEFKNKNYLPTEYPISRKELAVRNTPVKRIDLSINLPLRYYRAARPEIRFKFDLIRNPDNTVNFHKLLELLKNKTENINSKLYRILYNSMYLNDMFNSVHFLIVNDSFENYYGKYHFGTLSMKLNEYYISKKLAMNPELDPELFIAYVINHEIIHMTTPNILFFDSQYIDDVLNGKENFEISPTDLEYVKNIKELYDIAIKELPELSIYDVAEFIARLITDEEVQRKLATIPYKTTKQSLYKRFISILSDFFKSKFGININNTLLEAAIVEVGNYIHQISDYKTIKTIEVTDNNRVSYLTDSNQNTQNSLRNIYLRKLEQFGKLGYFNDNGFQTRGVYKELIPNIKNDLGILKNIIDVKQSANGVIYLAYRGRKVSFPEIREIIKNTIPDTISGAIEETTIQPSAEHVYYKSENIVDLVNNIVKYSINNEQTSWMYPLFVAFSKDPNLKNVQFEFRDEILVGEDSVPGAYEITEDGIKIFIKTGLDETTFNIVAAHELTHAFTHGEYMRNKEFKNKIDKLFEEALTYKDKIMDNGKPLGEHPGMKSPAEFMAYGLTNYSFMNELHKLKSEIFEKRNNNSIFSEFISSVIDIIKDLFRKAGINVYKKNIGSNLLKVISNYAQITQPNRSELSKEASKYTYGNDNAVNEQYQLESDTTKPIEELDNIIKNWFRIMGIDYRSVDEIATQLNLNPVAKADIVKKIIEVVEGRRDATTLSEEAAHFLVAMLPVDSSLYKAMMSKIESTEMYKKVYKEYYDAYKGDVNKLKIEAVGKLIAQEVFNLYKETKEKEQNINYFKRLFNNIINFIKNKFGNRISSSRMESEINPFRKAAEMLLSGETKGLNINEINEDPTDEKYYYYSLSSQAANLRDEIISGLNTKKIVLVGDEYFRVSDNKQVKYRVSDKVKEFKRKIFKNPLPDLDTEESEIKKAVGSVIHAIEQKIIQKLINKQEINKEQILNEVRNDIYSNPLRAQVFNRLRVNPFHLGYNEFADDQSFAELVNGAKLILKQIEENTKRVNALAGTNGEAVIYTELSVYDEESDLGGTIDLLVIYPNGVAGIYDFKSSTIYGNSKLSEYQLMLYEEQLSLYKKILSKNYKVKDFADSRIIPISVEYDKDLTKVNRVRMGGDETGLQNRSHLNPILIKEMTFDKEFNEKALERLYAYRDKLRNQLNNDYNNEKIKARLDRIDAVISQMLLKGKINYIIEELNAINVELGIVKLVDSESETAKPITNEKIEEINEFIRVFENIPELFLLHKEGAINQEYIKKVGEIKIGISLLKERMMRLTREMIDKVNPNYSIDTPSKNLGFFTRIFSPLNEIDHPAFKKITTLVREISWNVNKDVQRVIDEITVKRDNLKNWASANGITLQQAYDKMINPETGNLYGMLSRKYFEDRDAVFKSGDFARIKSWIEENHTFDREAFERARKAKLESLNKKYKVRNEFTIRAINKIMEDFDRKYDIRYQSAINEDNKFLKIDKAKIRKEYLSDVFKEMEMPGNAPLADFYNTLVKYNMMFAEMTGKDINKYFIAEIRRDIVEKVSYNGIGSLFNMAGNIRDALEVYDNDEVFGTIDPLTGDRNKSIPLLYSNQLMSSATKEQIREAEEKIGAIYEKGSQEYLDAMAKEIEKIKRRNGIAHKNTDLTKGLILFARAAYSYKYLSETESYVNNLVYYLENQGGKSVITNIQDKPVVDRHFERVTTKLGLPKDDLEALNSFIDSFWYGINVRGKDASLGKREIKDSEGNVIDTNARYSAIKGIKMFLQYFMLKSLGLNPYVAGGNLIGSRANLFMLAAEGRFFTIDQAMKAHKYSLSDREKYLAAAEIINPYATDIIREKANELSADNMSRLLTTENLLIMMKKPDETIDRLVTVSMMLNYGVDINGNIVNISKLPKGSNTLYDLITKVGDKWELRGVKESELIKFRDIVRKQTVKIKGAVPVEYKATYSRTVIGMILMQFRSWIPGLAAARFKKAHFDEDLDTVDVGRMRVLFGEIINSGGVIEGIKESIALITEAAITGWFGRGLKKTNKNASLIAYNNFLAENSKLLESMGKTITFEEFVEMRTAKLQGAMMELRLYTLLFMLMTLLRNMLFGDDDDEKKEALDEFFIRNTYILANRGYLELSFWLQPTSFKAITKQVAPSLGLLTDLEYWAKNTVKVSKYMLTGEYSGNKPPRAFRYTSEFVPIVNQAANVFDLYGTFVPR